mgnify:CR=1 FL=1
MVALEIAVDIANKLECDIKVVWVQREKLLIDEEQQKTMVRLAEAKLRDMCADHQGEMKYGTIRWEICRGKVAPVINREARHNNSPMVVIGANGASGFEKYWMGSTAVRIVQESPVPVLTIRKGFDFHKPLERIVVPLRVNINSRQKVSPAAAMAKLFGSEIHILGLYDDVNQQGELQIYLKQATDHLDKVGVPHVTELREYSNYSDTVLEYSEGIKADLIVINTEQDRIISQLFLGTNAQQIVHNSQLPVLCIHPADIVSISK